MINEKQMVPTLLFVLFLVTSSSTLPLADFFPFGPQAGDSVIDSYNSSADHLPLPYTFPYFDNTYDKIWITSNGLFSFLRPNSYLNRPALTSLSNDSCLVAGFWLIDVGSTGNSTGNKVYYQVYSNASVEVLNKTSNYVQNFFPQQRPFRPKMVITGTWYYISAEDYNNETDSLNNTFQIVLSTDEDRSFVFFLYHDLQWSDPYNSTYYNYNARAGFHDGKRNITVMLPYSGTADSMKLVNESNVNVPGLFAFRVDAEKLNEGGCNANVSEISFRPRSSPQFGSTPLTIYGPCFTNETIVKCRFGSSAETVDGIVVDEFRAICLTPFASVHGPISVNVSIDNGQKFISAGTFTYSPLQIGSDEVIIDIEGDDNLLNVRQNVTLKWHFSEIIKNTFPNSTKIEIELWKVSLNQESQLQKDNQRVVLAQNLDLINSIRVQLPDSISNISTCFIRIVAHFNSHIYAGLNTGLLIVRSHSSLATESCQNWATQQREPSTWNNDGLLQCPMTRWQAIAAGRCCYLPDQQCRRDSSNSKNCWLHRARSGYDEPSAIDCYVSITRNRHGAGAECCYDKNETLITRGTGAGTDDRYYPTASPVEHFFHDTLPYLQCCMMSTDAEACNKYMHYRPPRRGSNTMGQSGLLWGDPHFGTLDGASYTFNGHGEYTYLAISKLSPSPAAFDDINESYIFMSQIRTIPLSSNEATITKGFAACFNNSKTEAVSLIVSRREQLILRRGKEILEFEDNINIFFFPELTISRLDGNNNSHFSFSWTIGVTIEITVTKVTSSSQQLLVLNVAASVDGSFHGRTYGLLGTYDGTADNDLRSKNGNITSRNASLERIHEDFGVTWAIEPSNTLFYYESDQSAEYFQNRNRAFKPSFSDPTAINNPTIRNACKINATSPTSEWSVAQRACYYDFSVTNDKDFAQASLKAGDELLSIRNNQINLPSFNPSLPLSMDLKHGDPVHFIISATSDNPSHAVGLFVVNLPVNSTFNSTTGSFNWTAIKGEHYVSIEARDQVSNVTSKHDINFNVNAADEPFTTPNATNASSTTPNATDASSTTRNVTESTTKSNYGVNNQLNYASFIVSILGMIICFYQ